MPDLGPSADGQLGFNCDCIKITPLMSIVFSLDLLYIVSLGTFTPTQRNLLNGVDSLQLKPYFINYVYVPSFVHAYPPFVQCKQ